jgi:hypothetical protein
MFVLESGIAISGFKNFLQVTPSGVEVIRKQVGRFGVNLTINADASARRWADQERGIERAGGGGASKRHSL